ncbi:MAG: M56 family metallopeptidase [Clostridiales bacterium]|nr:M56 family metallopeptidase [Clostridiales bacterium]
MSLGTVFSRFSLLMALLFFTVFSLVCSQAAKKAGWHSLRALGFGILLVLLRFLLPLEASFAKIIHGGKLFTELDLWLHATRVGSLNIVHIVCILWAAGTLFCLVRILAMLCRQYRVVRRSRTPQDGEIPRFCRSVAREMGISRAGAVCISPSFEVPMMAGFFRPNILLPQDVEHLPEEELRLILRHEYTHFHRGDLWIKLGMELLCCLLWWNPGAYLLRTSIGQLLELRCDSLVCARLSPRESLQYGETLLHVLQGLHRKPSCFAAGFFGYTSREKILQRFGQIASVKQRPKQRGISILIAALAVVLFIGSYSFLFQPYALPPELGSDYEVASDLDSSFILRYSDGTLEVYINNRLRETITSDQLNQEPYCNMQIFDVQISYEEEVIIP